MLGPGWSGPVVAAFSRTRTEVWPPGVEAWGRLRGLEVKAGSARGQWWCRTPALTKRVRARAHRRGHRTYIARSRHPAPCPAWPVGSHWALPLTVLAELS